MTAFRSRDGVVEVRFAGGDAAVLRELVGQVRALLHDRAEQAGAPPAVPDDADPLDALEHIADGAPPGAPDDPALARLLPDARRDDTGQAAEYRRLTEGDLRRGKLRDADALLESLPEDGRRVQLSAQDADAWLRALNDVRLAMGTRLGVEEDTPVPRRARTPEEHALIVYYWLGWLQESLLQALNATD